ncbi:cell division protein ZapA [Sandarakinorhabdus sp.]|uniref:cell division protein ZapA n=1 Tax=Sandarakinorhabdus sp. TaxID=1916663 RepID=UPI003F7286DF
MAQVAITVGAHHYRIAARDGDEIRIERLGEELAARAARLTKALGVMSEAQTLVMVALMLADELAEARSGGAAVAAAEAPAMPTPDLARLTRIVERLEALSST